jgi:hypothetical protein
MRGGRLEFRFGRWAIGRLPRGALDYSQARVAFSPAHWLLLVVALGTGILVGWLIWG